MKRISLSRCLKRAAGILFSGFMLCHAAMAQSVPAAMNDYWTGKAQWEPAGKWLVGITNINGSSTIRIVNGTWYMFARTILPSPCAGDQQRDEIFSLSVLSEFSGGNLFCG